MKIKLFTHDESIAVLIPIWGPKDETGTERGLMHREPNKATRAYRRSDLLEKRRLLMQAWADAVLPMGVIEKQAHE